jgi:uncharacterized membrane protein
MKDWTHTAIVMLLRTGVALSVILITTGITVTFVHHPEYFKAGPELGRLTSPDTHFPSSFGAVVDGVRRWRGQALIMAGLLVLIATPVARVALSVIIFVIVRDWTYTGLTATVLIILLLSFAVGVVAG